MNCTLCSIQLPKNPIREGENAFCCKGCLTVFAIIGRHENYLNHPLFQEALKSGVISNPQRVHREENKSTAKEVVKLHLQVDGLWCHSCADAICMILMRQNGVENCIVDYATDLAIISINPILLTQQRIIELIRKLGYQATELFSKEKKEISRSLWFRLAITIFCAMNIIIFSYPLCFSYFGVPIEGCDRGLGWLSFILTLPLVTYSAWPIWKRLIVSFKTGLFGMEVLVFIGTMTAFSLSTYNLFQSDFTNLYFDSLSLVLCFILLGKILERKAKFSAKDIFVRLSHYLPKKAFKQLESGAYTYVPIKEVSCGDILLVRTGEKIVLDGVVIEGNGLVDEMIMTGESIPCQKIKGNEVIGGSIVKQGSFTMRVTKDRLDSLLVQIISLIEHDLTKKNVTDSFVSKITHFFVPVVLLLALLAIYLFGPMRALTILLISCPCALGIAVPLVQSRLIFRFAQKGALIRNRNRVCVLAQNPFFVFDKTGTLTEGKFRVLKGMEKLSAEKITILKSLVSTSNHPISFAISDALFCSSMQLEEVAEIVGRGIKGKYQGNNYLLGSKHFLQEKGIETLHHDDLITAVYFVENETILTEIHLGDQLRTHLPKLDGGVLSGDSQYLVSNIAKKCGLQWGKGSLDPFQKREEILNLKSNGRPVIMVGDGVNDAPAMTAADLGISVVSATDLTVEVSDVLLTTDHLDELPQLCQLMKKCKKIIRQNLFWAFFYNSVGILLAIFGFLNPFFAAFAMVVSSLCVIFNSYRL